MKLLIASTSTGVLDLRLEPGLIGYRAHVEPGKKRRFKDSTIESELEWLMNYEPLVSVDILEE